MTLVTSDMLGEFVSISDSLGGPNTEGVKQYWQEFQYKPTTFVDQDLDPFSDAYFNQQIELYHELSGRTIDPSVNEMTAFDMAHHIEGANPYGSRDPSNFAIHYLRLAHAIKDAGLPPHPLVLDMGAGWGLSSEFFATLGCRVTAVDINPAFVRLIEQRRLRHQLDITAVQGSFDGFEPKEQFDAVFFYECLHHAMRPWELIARAAKWLRAGGKIVFAGEPVNDFWWRNWGLRLDAYSVYCIHKFGWFESGWSRPFIIECFNRAGLSAALIDIAEHDIGSICVATKVARDDFLTPSMLAKFIEPSGWYLSEQYLAPKGDAAININCPDGVSHINFQIRNFRTKPIALTVTNGGVVEISKSIEPGESTIRCELAKGVTHLNFRSETWIPSEEIGTVDNRKISFHIAGATLT